MTKSFQSPRKRGKFQQTDKVDKKSLWIGSILATIIAASPYLFYLYESVPESQVWDTFLFSYDSKSWESANYAMWIFTGKAIPLLFLLIWFFTNRHWWYHVLLVPIAMYIYQIFGIFHENISYIDKFELIHLLPIMAIFVPSIYLLRARMFDKLNTADKSLEELEEEFKIKPKSFLDKLGDYF
ncbi:MAG: hypothetical protein KJN68_10970 [Bacteroidia bacterium]|nr:hypothetical protein [Bacteroidia bacterium]